MTQDEMVGCHHRLNGHEFDQFPGVGGQGSLACCSLWGCKELDTTEPLNLTRGVKVIETDNINRMVFFCRFCTGERNVKWV